jgi:3-hydroxyisobutyrate dehydrogenase-like beta-hydroxyacid dehydrogenase
MTRIALIGLGEVGGILARDLAARGTPVIAAYDERQREPGSRPARQAREFAVPLAPSAVAAARGADLVIAAVTAGSAERAAREAAPGLAPGALYMDVNSVSPGAKAAIGATIHAAGARFVEAAVMTSVPPHGMRAPMLLGGPHAAEALALLTTLGFRADVFSEEIGRASAVKMCRSVMIKGIEALVTECLLTARHHKVEREVLASLGDTLPHPDWPRQARYMMGRALVHGRRRAEEMREVARTVREAGLPPMQSAATAERQDWTADLGQRLDAATLDEADLGRMLDALRAALGHTSDR